MIGRRPNIFTDQFNVVLTRNKHLMIGLLILLLQLNLVFSNYFSIYIDTDYPKRPIGRHERLRLCEYCGYANAFKGKLNITNTDEFIRQVVAINDITSGKLLDCLYESLLDDSMSFLTFVLIHKVLPENSKNVYFSLAAQYVKFFRRMFLRRMFELQFGRTDDIMKGFLYTRFPFSELIGPGESTFTVDVTEDDLMIEFFGNIANGGKNYGLYFFLEKYLRIGFHKTNTSFTINLFADFPEKDMLFYTQRPLRGDRSHLLKVPAYLEQKAGLLYDFPEVAARSLAYKFFMNAFMSAASPTMAETFFAKQAENSSRIKSQYKNPIQVVVLTVVDQQTVYTPRAYCDKVGLMALDYNMLHTEDYGREDDDTHRLPGCLFAMDIQYRITHESMLRASLEDLSLTFSNCFKWFVDYHVPASAWDFPEDVMGNLTLQEVMKNYAMALPDINLKVVLRNLLLINPVYPACFSRFVLSYRSIKTIGMASFGEVAEFKERRLFCNLFDYFKLLNLSFKFMTFRLYYEMVSNNVAAFVASQCQTGVLDFLKTAYHDLCVEPVYVVNFYSRSRDSVNSIMYDIEESDYTNLAQLLEKFSAADPSFKMQYEQIRIDLLTCHP